jgi:hypothetical protein
MLERWRGLQPGTQGSHSKQHSDPGFHNLPPFDGAFGTFRRVYFVAASTRGAAVWQLCRPERAASSQEALVDVSVKPVSGSSCLRLARKSR